MLKKTVTVLMTICVMYTFAQKNESISIFDRFSKRLSASFESNSQWYLKDSYVDNPNNPNQIGEERLRTTNFLRLDYQFSEKFSAGLQLESYTPENLLNMSNLYDED